MVSMVITGRFEKGENLFYFSGTEPQPRNNTN